MTQDEQIKQLKQELEYYKKNSVMICGVSSNDDNGEEFYKDLGIKENETFFDFDAEGFVEDALYQLKSVLKYDKVFRNGGEIS